MVNCEKLESKRLRCLPISDVRLSNAEHVHGGLVDLDKHAVVYLSESEELEALSHFGMNAVNTRIRRENKIELFF